MKFNRFNRTIRMQLVLMEMGTAMLFAIPARAQQDVDPTSFEVTPCVPPAQQAHQVETPKDLQAAERRTAGAGRSVIRHEKDETLDGGLAQLTLIDVVILAVLMAGSGFIALFAIAQTLRENRKQTSRQSAPTQNRPEPTTSKPLKSLRPPAKLRESCPRFPESCSFLTLAHVPAG